VSPAEIASIRPLLDKIGMPYVSAPDREEPWFGWNGEALNLAHDDNTAFSGDLLHEVAHWLVAPAEWRSDPGFGLMGERFSDTAREDDEEELASILGILMERHLALDWRSTWRDHDWGQHGPLGGATMRRCIRHLRSRGLLRGLTPTCFL
jgi:hypothetical protein